MKLITTSLLLTFLLLFTLSACVQRGNTENSSAISNIADLNKYYGTVFGQGEITDINIEMNEDDWADILKNPKDEEYHSANITVNGNRLENIGVRTKGFSSLNSVAESSDSNRYGLKIKTDEYVEGQTLHGIDMFVLNGSFSDPSYMREYLTYLATKKLDGITPFVSYTNLHINGELFGFYLMIESYDDSFVKRNAAADNSVLYKANSENCTLLTSDDASGFEVECGQDEGNFNIKKLIAILNSTTIENKNELEAVFDVDSALKAWAINTVMGNYDSYSGSKAHNYYLLYKDGRFSYIGWDYNMSIGGFSEDGGASVSVDISSPVYNVDISKRPLIGKLLAIQEYKDRYTEYVNTLLDYFAEFDKMVSDISNEISSHVETDPTAFYTFEQYKDNLTASSTDLTQIQNNRPKGLVKGSGNEMPPIPEGKERPDRQIPSTPEGTERSDSQMPHPSKDSMISHDTVSIVDYITQRCKIIATQISDMQKTN